MCTTPGFPMASSSKPARAARRTRGFASPCQLVFVLAAITEQNTHMLDDARLDLLQRRARLVLVSRAAAIDFDALYTRVRDGRILAAIDVWPHEPMPVDDPCRSLEGAVLSAHRAGGILQAFQQIGAVVLDDLLLIHRELPPARMQVAARELVTRYRSRPAAATHTSTAPDTAADPLPVEALSRIWCN
jgi:phosphoglycerate dehydrogenase-like enzyme